MAESSHSADPIVINPQSRPTSNEHKGTFTDHLANERTFLAWIRTGLGIFALGYAITRLHGADDLKPTLNGSFQERKPIISGLILVACGIIAIFYSVYRFYRINRQIIERDLTDVSQIREPITATIILLLSMIAIFVIFVIL